MSTERVKWELPFAYTRTIPTSTFLTRATATNQWRTPDNETSHRYPSGLTPFENVNKGITSWAIWQPTVVRRARLVVTLYQSHSTSPSPSTLPCGSNHWASSLTRRREIWLVIMANRATPSGIALDIRRKVSKPLFPLKHFVTSDAQYQTLGILPHHKVLLWIFWFPLCYTNPLLVLFKKIHRLFSR